MEKEKAATLNTLKAQTLLIPKQAKGLQGALRRIAAVKNKKFPSGKMSDPTVPKNAKKRALTLFS